MKRYPVDLLNSVNVLRIYLFSARLLNKAQVLSKICNSAKGSMQELMMPEICLIALSSEGSI